MSLSQSRYQGYADLHTHSYHSDGVETPSEVVSRASAIGLSGISLTDHDNVDGIAEASQKASQLGMRFLAGVELSTVSGKTEVHILGYFPNEPSKGFLELIDRMKSLRITRMKKMISNLNELGCPVEEEFVFAYKGSGTIGRAHLFRAIKDRFKGDFDDRASKWLNIGGAAFEPTSDMSPAEAVAEIRKGGGVPVIAHPGSSGADLLLEGLVKDGLMGIEAYYPSHERSAVSKYRKFAAKHGLIVTGGSDWHGNLKADLVYHSGNVGASKVIIEVMDEIIEMSGRMKKEGLPLPLSI